MDVRELPKILLKEFCSNAVQESVRDIQRNQREVWMGYLSEDIGITVFDNLPMRDKYLKIWRERDCGIQDGSIHRPAFFEIYVGPEFLYHDKDKGNIYRDKVAVHWPTRQTDLKEESFLTLILRIIIRAQELIATGAFEFPTYTVSSEHIDGVRIPI